MHANEPLIKFWLLALLKREGLCQPCHRLACPGQIAIGGLSRNCSPTHFTELEPCQRPVNMQRLGVFEGVSWLRDGTWRSGSRTSRTSSLGEHLKRLLSEQLSWHAMQRFILTISESLTTDLRTENFEANGGERRAWTILMSYVAFLCCCSRFYYCCCRCCCCGHQL